MTSSLAILDYVDGVRRGDRAMIGRTITLVESSTQEHRAVANAVLRELLPHAGQAFRVGITGSPGVGKSTLIDALGMQLVEQGHRLAVLAVDPTSRRSGGSILGDKTRMERLSADPRCFIRPSPSGGVLGGVASRTRETMLVLEAAGYDLIFVETVGVGQSETVVRSMVDAFMLLVLPGSGDELQGVKRGIMELADLLVVTKADSGNELVAQKTRQEHEAGLHYLPPSTPGWTTPALTCSALQRQGLDELWRMLRSFFEHAKFSGSLRERRRHQMRDWLRSLVEERVLELLNRSEEVQRAIPRLEARIDTGDILPSDAAEEIADLFTSSRATP